MPKVLSTGDVKLFLNTFPHVQANIFSVPCHEASSAGLFVFVIVSDTMKKFVGLIHPIKPA